MDTLSAFARAHAAGDSPIRVFEWNKAAQIIKERSAQEAEAGLQLDMEWTSGTILRDGKPVPKDDTYVYLASNWATPVLVIDGEEIECWAYQSDTPDWDSDTYWPESALAALA